MNHVPTTAILLHYDSETTFFSSSEFNKNAGY